MEAEAGFSVFVDYAHTHDALENVLTALRATMGRRGLVQNLASTCILKTEAIGHA